MFVNKEVDPLIDKTVHLLTEESAADQRRNGPRSVGNRIAQALPLSIIAVVTGVTTHKLQFFPVVMFVLRSDSDNHSDAPLKIK